jgi:hypothetical protein
MRLRVRRDESAAPILTLVDDGAKLRSYRCVWC